VSSWRPAAGWSIRAGRVDEGTARLREALALFADIGTTEAEAVRARLAAEVEEP
jgi:hypothetical protein